MPRGENLRLSSISLTDCSIDSRSIECLRKFHTKRLVIEKFKFNRFGYGSPRSTIVFRRADYRRFPDHGQRDCRNYTHPRSIPLNSLGTHISNDGLKPLRQFKHLTYLILNRTDISDQGMESLEEIKTLQQLLLHSTKVSKAGISRLANALPNCEITWDGWHGQTLIVDQVGLASLSPRLKTESRSFDSLRGPAKTHRAIPRGNPNMTSCLR